MQSEQLLSLKMAEIVALCQKYSVRRLRLFGSALGNGWNPETSDFDFVAEFGAPTEWNAFDRYMGFLTEMEALLGTRVDVVDRNAATNPFFKRHIERTARELYAA